MSHTGRSDPEKRRDTRFHALETSYQILESALESIDSAERTALDLAERAGFGETDLEGIGIAVHEVVANAVIHGNHLDCHKKVVMTILRTAEQFKVSVWDQGTGFDLESLPDPRNPDVLLLPYGRGIHLARVFMDEFQVQPGPANGTTVTMIRHIRASGTSLAPGLTRASQWRL